MSGLTRVPLQLIDPGKGFANDQVLFNGQNLELQDPEENTSDAQITAGQYDAETGTLTLTKADRSVVLIRGLLTKSSVGVGPTGPTGPQGSQGVNGRNGKDGRRGDTGCVGPKGDPGPAGNTGPAGPSGGPGTIGATGPTGPEGKEGKAGRDGKMPTFGVSESGGYELYSQGSLKLWGRFTTADAAIFQRVVFPEAFTTEAQRVVVLQFVDPASPVKNAVRIDKVNKGNMELSVVQSRLPQVADGAGGTKAAPATGWDFFWFVIASEGDV
jgi:hypothetical protein